MRNTSISCASGRRSLSAGRILRGVFRPRHVAQAGPLRVSAKGSAPAASAAVAVKPAVVADVAAKKQPEPTPAKIAAKGNDETEMGGGMLPPSSVDAKTVKVGACDGGKAVEVPKALTGQPLADSLMDQWNRNHPEAKWVAEEKERHTLKPAADNADLLKGGQAKGDTYGNFTQRDLLTWARETEKFAAEGSRIFHNADELGSTVAVSCDMCHPHAANTHPETYPKFQVQLGRVVLLRDMINWCVENPVRGAS